MRANHIWLIERHQSHRLTITITTLLAALLLLSAIFASGSVITASDHGSEESVAQATEGDEEASPAVTDVESNLELFDRMEQAPGLYTETQITPDRIESNLEAFDRMERAPGLYTETQAVPNRIESNLEAFDRMEQAPGLYTD
jgi:hypothetical protein